MPASARHLYEDSAIGLDVPCLLTQLATIMAAQPLSDADKAAKAALFSRLVEVLPGLLSLRPSQGLAPVADALETVCSLVAGRSTAHQNLFRWCPCASCRLLVMCSLCSGQVATY
jgi:hypothetical protein